jgi:hypothetical protein
LYGFQKHVVIFVEPVIFSTVKEFLVCFGKAGRAANLMFEQTMQGLGKPTKVIDICR